MRLRRARRAGHWAASRRPSSAASYPRPASDPRRTYVLCSAAMRAEYREEPCRSALNRVDGHALRLVAQPVHGLRAPLHVLLRPRVRAARRPARRRALRHVDPGEGERRRGAAARARAAVVAAASASRSAPRPTPTSRPRAATGSRAPASRCSPRPRTRSALITRGPLIVRDLDVLAEAAKRAEVSVTFSVPTLDDEVWRRTEPGTAPPRQRLRALSQLVDAGIRASVGMAPILPGISDRPGAARRGRPRRARGRRLRDLGERAPPAGPGTREHFLESLARDWPELLPEYERLYGARAYLPSADASAGAGRRARARPRARHPRPAARAARAAAVAGAARRCSRSEHRRRRRRSAHTIAAHSAGRDHDADRRRPRGRPRGPPALALARAAHPRRRRGRRRRERGRRSRSAASRTS